MKKGAETCEKMRKIGGFVRRSGKIGGRFRVGFNVVVLKGERCRIEKKES